MSKLGLRAQDARFLIEKLGNKFTFQKFISWPASLDCI